MKYPTYPLIFGENDFVYTFFSEGPRGRIRKAIFYTKIASNLYNTPARTRLYQMGIAHNQLEISKAFEILGLSNGTWLAFRPGQNYEAFLVTRK